MPLLDIPKPSQKVKATVSLEQSTVDSIDRYAEYCGASGDEVIEQALQYVFRKDADFQKHIAAHKDKAPAASLTIAAKPGRKANGNS